MKDLLINNLQHTCREKRTTAHQTQLDSDWKEFRDARNALKRTIKHTKKLSIENFSDRKNQRKFGN